MPKRRRALSGIRFRRFQEEQHEAFKGMYTWWIEPFHPRPKPLHIEQN